MRPQYRTANQLNSETAPMTFSGVGVSASGCMASAGTASRVSKNNALSPAIARKATFAHQTRAAQVQVRLHDQEQRAGDGVDEESADRPRHQRLDVADGEAAKQAHQPKSSRPAPPISMHRPMKCSDSDDRPQPGDAEQRLSRSQVDFHPGSEFSHRQTSASLLQIGHQPAGDDGDGPQPEGRGRQGAGLRRSRPAARPWRSIARRFTTPPAPARPRCSPSSRRRQGPRRDRPLP